MGAVVGRLPRAVWVLCVWGLQWGWESEEVGVGPEVVDQGGGVEAGIGEVAVWSDEVEGTVRWQAVVGRGEVEGAG